MQKTFLLEMLFVRSSEYPKKLFKKNVKLWHKDRRTGGFQVCSPEIGLGSVVYIDSPYVFIYIYIIMNIYIYIYHYEHIRKCIMFEEKAFIIQIPDILLFVMLVWKNLEDLQLATTGVVGGCWWPSLFQVLTLTFSEKENQNRKSFENMLHMRTSIQDRSRHR